MLLGEKKKMNLGFLTTQKLLDVGLGSHFTVIRKRLENTLETIDQFVTEERALPWSQAPLGNWHHLPVQSSWPPGAGAPGSSLIIAFVPGPREAALLLQIHRLLPEGEALSYTPYHMGNVSRSSQTLYVALYHLKALPCPFSVEFLEQRWEMSYLTYEEVSAQRSNRTSPQAPDSSVDLDSDSNLSVLLL